MLYSVHAQKLSNQPLVTRGAIYLALRLAWAAGFTKPVPSIIRGMSIGA